MNDFFSKPIDKITAKDIIHLRDTPEGQMFEIKAGLASKKGKADPWLTEPGKGKTRAGPGDHARKDLFKEVVAFANSEGGWLVLGLEETSDKPKRAAGVVPIPDCHDLAEKLRRAAQDWIDPPILSLRCKGVTMDAAKKEGAVVFRVPPSPNAPHRLDKRGLSQEAYRRVNDESKPMKMREIQNLTLDIARRREILEYDFKEARRDFLKFKPVRVKKNHVVGFRITLVPTAGPCTIDRPYLEKDLFVREQIIEGVFEGNVPLNIETIDYKLPSRSLGAIHPILRGARQVWSSVYNSDEDSGLIEIKEKGTINLFVKSTFSQNGGLSIRWILAELGNALRMVERVRLRSNNQSAEFALEIEIRGDYYSSSGKRDSIAGFNFGFGLLADEENYRIKLSSDPLVLPRYRVGSFDEFADLIKRVMDDLYNSVGKEHIDDFEIQFSTGSAK